LIKIMPLNRAMLQVLVAAAIAVLAGSISEASAQAEVSLGSATAARVIAVSRSGRQWGMGHAAGGDRSSVSIRAAQEAMTRCARSDCRVQFQSVNPNDRCMSIAQGMRGGYAIGIGVSQEAAHREALNSCRIMGLDCRVAENRCY
jgi:Domain of unknown function (DUF4189)